MQELANYVRAMEYGLEQVRSRGVSLSLIRELHQILMSGVWGEEMNPGAFREEQDWIGNNRDSKVTQARYVPPMPIEVGESLRQLEAYIQTDDSLPPLMRVAMVHYQFEAIHPFLDGNGRVGRLLISLLLDCWQLLELPLLYLSAYFDARRSTYYDSLLGVSTDSAWKQWLLFFLEGVAQQSLDATRKVERLQALQSEWRSRMTQCRSTALTLHLIDQLFTIPVLTIPLAVRLLGVTYRATKLHVEKLADVGILTQLGGESYRKMYIAQEVIDIMASEAT